MSTFCLLINDGIHSLHVKMHASCKINYDDDSNLLLVLFIRAIS
jgi:hypothetical protein